MKQLSFPDRIAVLGWAQAMRKESIGMVFIIFGDSLGQNGSDTDIQSNQQFLNIEAILDYDGAWCQGQGGAKKYKSCSTTINPECIYTYQKNGKKLSYMTLNQDFTDSNSIKISTHIRTRSKKITKYLYSHNTKFALTFDISEL